MSTAEIIGASGIFLEKDRDAEDRQERTSRYPRSK
jgi:hypothetical protein